MKKLFWAATMAAASIFSSAAFADIVTFDDVANPNNPPYAGYAPFSFDDGGLTFNVGGDWFGGVWDGTSPNSNGTNNLIYSTDAEDGALTITRQGGGAFDLVSLQMAISWYDPNALENVVINGNLMLINQTLTTYTLNLDNVTSVQITGFGAGYYWTADNIVYTAASVPEPGTLALFGAALLALGGLGLRRKSV